MLRVDHADRAALRPGAEARRELPQIQRRRGAEAERGCDGRRSVDERALGREQLDRDLLTGQVVESEQRFHGGDAAAADQDPWAISDAHEQNRMRRSGGRHRAKRLGHVE